MPDSAPYPAPHPVSPSSAAQPAFTPSRYNVLVPLEAGRTLAYNGLSGAFALWEEADAAVFGRLTRGELLDPNHPAIGGLLQGGFVVGGGVDELAVLEQHYRAYRFDPGSMVLTVAPTMACNFGCDYCFQGQDKPAETMPAHVQDATVDLVRRALPKLRRVHVAWYGGEPLLRRPVVEALSDRMIALCAEANVAYDAMMVSNGYLLSAEAGRSLHARKVKSIQVTLDGTPNYHDQRRSLLSGKPTFERIARNVSAVVLETPIHVMLRVNIDARNRDEILGLLDFLAAAGLGHRPNFQVYFAPVEAMTEGCHAVQDVTLSKVDYGSLEAELCREACVRGLTPLPYPPRYRGVCGAVRPKGFVILPTGAVHKCWDTVADPGRAIGTVLDLDALSRSEGAKPWLTWTPFSNASCRNCRILPVCAGSCAYKFVHAEDTRGEAAKLPCPSWKYNLQERLVYRAEAMGAITAADYDRERIRTRPEALCVTPAAPEPDEASEATMSHEVVHAAALAAK